MKKCILIAATLILSAPVYAADTKQDDKQGGMMMDCQKHMKDGKMMGDMPKGMMSQCQDMMKKSDAKPAMDMAPDAAKASESKDHSTHH